MFCLAVYLNAPIVPQRAGANIMISIDILSWTKLIQNIVHILNNVYFINKHNNITFLV